MLEEPPGREIVANIGPLETLSVGNTVPSIAVASADLVELEGGTPFLLETTMPETEEAIDPREILLSNEEIQEISGIAEARLELEARRGEEGYPPFVVKLAHVMIVLLA